MCEFQFSYVVAAFLVGYILSFIFSLALIPRLLDRLGSKLDQRKGP